VPAKVAGAWTTPEGTLTLKQEAQMLTGTLARPGGEAVPVTGRLRGTELVLQVQQQELKGRVNGGTIDATRANGNAWRATRIP